MFVLQVLFAPSAPFFPPGTFATLAPPLIAFGWFIVAGLSLWYLRELQEWIEFLDYFKSIRWVMWEILLPEDADQTPKAMEIAISVLSGVHKSPDAYEKYFEGYIEAIYSLELHCQKGKARYILVAPEVQRQFFEGVIYGQYPTAQLKEVPDYTQRFKVTDLRNVIRKQIDVYASQIVFAKSDVYPIRTYKLYGDPLAPTENFIDPHQGLVEAYTSLDDGEEFWLQILVHPMDILHISEWAEEGLEEIEKIKEAGEVEGQAHFYDPVETARMEGIVEKIGGEGYLTVIRVVHIAPVGKLKAENMQRTIGAFSQFNTLHLNALMLDPKTKTNGPMYAWKDLRRFWRERRQMYFYYMRFPGARHGGQMYSAEELATLYHFPTKWIKTPGLERARSARDRPPGNLPMV
ncbi:MAG: hypothetical protein AAB538_00705 [Patescibacteria group bacterium]